jgi:hypothetical protein
MALCVANFVDTLIRAKAMVEEYTFRYNKSHKSHAKLVWLLDHASEMQLHGAVWDEWLRRERIGKDTNGVSYEEWFASYGYYQNVEPKTYVWEKHVEGCMTHFPQIMNPKHFPGARVLHDAVAAGRTQYAMKAGAIGSKKPMKQMMRYCTRPPPAWLCEMGVTLQTSLKKNIRKK